MATATRTITINAAFFQEIKDDNSRLRELLAALRDLTDNAVALTNQGQLLVGLLEELRDQLGYHFALEEAYGYFDEAIGVAPRITERAEELRLDHAILFESIRNLADAAAQWRQQRVTGHHDVTDAVHEGSTKRPTLRNIVVRYQQFRDQLRRHEQRENALIFDALGTDIGGEG